MRGVSEVRARSLPIPPHPSRLPTPDPPCLPHQRSVHAFAPLLAPHECFSGGIFRDGLLCKWHLSCDLPGEREGGSEGGEAKEGKRRRGKMEAEEGRTTSRVALICRTFSSPFCTLPHYFLLWGDQESILIFLNAPPPLATLLPGPPCAGAGRSRPCF